MAPLLFFCCGGSREGGSGVSSVSPLAGDDWFSAPEEKSTSNGFCCGVVNEGLRSFAENGNGVVEEEEEEEAKAEGFLEGSKLPNGTVEI